MRPGTTEGDRATVFRHAAGAEDLAKTSFLSGGDAIYLEQLLADFEADPASVSPDWRAFFQQMGVLPGSGSAAAGPSWASAGPPRAKDDLLVGFEAYAPEPTRPGPAATAAPAIRPSRPPESEALRQATRDSIRALMMIRAYRARGHLHANLDPLGLEQRSDHGELHPGTYGFTRRGLRPQDLHRRRSGSSDTRACSRSSRSCGAPTAARSASSSCMS